MFGIARADLQLGLQVGIVGAVAVGGLEAVVNAQTVWPMLEPGAHRTDLVIAAVGKSIALHALVWIPLFTLLAPLVARLAGAPPGVGRLPVLVALFALASGSVVGWAQLVLARGAGPGTGLLVLVALAVACGVGWGGLSWLVRDARRATALRRLLGVATPACLLLIALAIWQFATSAVFDPSKHRSAIARVDHAKPARPHVLWIVLDTVRADRTSLHAPELDTTPYLESFAARSQVFDHAFSNAIWTVPSHASMFTGMSLREHGMDFANLRLREGLPTVAEVLRQSGYRTAAFSNNPWISRTSELCRGFEICQVMTFARLLFERLSWDLVRAHFGWEPLGAWLDPDFGASLTDAIALDWLSDATRSSDPSFLFVNLMEAHLPYRVPRRYREQYLDEADVARSYRLEAGRANPTVASAIRKFNAGRSEALSKRDRRILEGQYLAAIRYLDDRVRELLSAYQDAGLLEQTLVIIGSDHGEYLGGHGMWGHHYLAHSDVSHVLLLLHRPGQERGARVAEPVQPSAVFETILDVSGVDRSAPPHTLATRRAGIAVTEYNGPVPTRLSDTRRAGNSVGDYRDVPQIAVSDGRHRYLVSETGRRELYDLSVDPGEEDDLFAEGARWAEPLADQLERWRQRVPQAPAAADSSPVTIDPEMLRQLESLGYLETAAERAP